MGRAQFLPAQRRRRHRRRLGHRAQHRQCAAWPTRPATTRSPQYVDIPNLINYMLVNFYGGNLDWDDHNWYSINRRTPEGDGYKFVCWDAERTLENTTGDNRTGVGQDDKPSRLYSQLRANPEFRLQFADQAHQAPVQRRRAHAGADDPALPGARRISSTARSSASRHAGATRSVRTLHAERRVGHGARPHPELLPAAAHQRRCSRSCADAGLYPSTDAPVFCQHGGHVASTTELSMSNGARHDLLHHGRVGPAPAGRRDQPGRQHLRRRGLVDHAGRRRFDLEVPRRRQ